MIGRGFILPFTALMMPMTAKTMMPHEAKPYKPLNRPRMMLSHEAPTEAMMTLLKVIRRDKPMDVAHKMSP